jgi:Fic-DOC domain mobile mystery protein B
MRGELDELEQLNIAQGLMWMLARPHFDILEHGNIEELHSRLFGEVWAWAGTYRRTEKTIGVDPVTISVDLRHLLDDARYWAKNKTYAPLEAAARFHHRLVQIHPFPNGNGRHARISADAYLSTYFEHDAVDWNAGQTLINNSERRNTYIAALRLADGHDFRALFDFVGMGKLNS